MWVVLVVYLDVDKKIKEWIWFDCLKINWGWKRELWEKGEDVLLYDYDVLFVFWICGDWCVF